MSAFCSDVDSIFAKMNAVYEGRRAELYLVLLKKLLQVDLAYYFTTLDVPMNYFGVIASS